MAQMPLYNTLALPGGRIWLRSQDYRELTGKTPASGEKVTLLMQKEDQARDELTAESFYPLAVAGTVTEADENAFVTIALQNRVHIDEIVQLPNQAFSMSVSRSPETDDLDPAEARRRTEAVKERILSFASGQRWEGFLRSFAEHWDSMWTIAGAMSPWLHNSVEERYALLAEDSVKARFDALEQMLLEGLEMVDVQSAAQSAQREDYEKLYRESAIKKQIEYLQKELDEMHPDELNGIRKLEIKIRESGMNETARKEADKLISRLKAEGQDSHEYGLLTDYLEFLTSLPWKKEEFRRIDLDEAEKVLDADHFGLEKVKRRILEQIAVMQLRKQQSGSILLFVGAPGTGKTSIGKSIARALGRAYSRVSLGGVHDESDIRGHRRTYIGAMPGRIMDGIQKSGVSNPVMVLDEVDKLSASYNGSPASALLEVLDPEQNSTFTDHYMNVPYDLSDVLFICTANSTDGIPEPLLNRMEVIQFTGYSPLEKLQIARRHLLPRSMEAMGIPEGKLTVPEETLEQLISDYTMEAGVRGLRKHIDALCRSLAVKVAENPEERFVVTPDVLRETLEERPIQHNEVLPEPRAGVVTGLAWTQAGGEILYIETLFTPGRGEVILTGQLGDVMKESARIALSLVKAAFPEKAELFRENDLHIHVPAGSVPKDGPSAGVTLTTALASLVTGRVVDPHIAMTGEVSLRGAVCPIGGLPEKLMAAQRAGVTRVYIPKANLFDLKDVAPEVKEKLEIIPVSSVTDLLTETGVLPREALSA